MAEVRLEGQLKLDVRPGLVDDLPAILQFIRELADYEKLSSSVTATEEMLRLHLFGETPAASVLIARADGTPVGFALYFESFSTFLASRGIHLEDLFVTQAHRGRGVGRALLSAVAAEAVRRGCGRLEWAVLDWNAAAIRFYESVGAVPMKEWTTMRVTGDVLDRLGGGGTTADLPGGRI